MNARKIGLCCIFALSLCGCEKSAQLIDALNEKIDHREDSFISNRDHKLKDAVHSHSVVIDGDTVVFAKSHLASVKTARFQPSFSLQGTVAPIKSLTLKTPIDSQVAAVFVKTGESVKKNQLLALLTPTTHSTQDALSHQQNDKTDELARLDDLENLDNLGNLDNSDNLDNSENLDNFNNSNKNKTDHTQSPHDESPDPIRVVASFGGMIGDVDVKVGDDLSAHAALLTLHDTKKYQFISHLPAHLKPHIKIGNTVELTVDGRPFGGQVARIDDNLDNFHQLDVKVEITTKKDSQKLFAGQFAKGVIEYGQIEVGALVPDFAIMGDDLQPIDLTELYTPPHKPQASIPAYVWVVKQNAKLQLAPIHVIEYLPSTRRFLVSGITQDSLIVLTSLPKSANGKQAIIR